MPKYTRMLCWINRNEEWGKELESLVSGKLPFILTDSCNDFENKISEGDYLVISILKAKNDLGKLKKLLKSHRQMKFHFLGHLAEDGYTIDEFEILDEENAEGPPCDPEELLLEATGKITDIYEYRGIQKT